jgi:hypothetical protein
MGLFGWMRFIITIAIGVGVLFAALTAIISASQRPERAFETAGKRTKKFWLLVLGAGLLFAALGVLGMIPILLNIAAVVPAAIYWYDVKPAVSERGKITRPMASFPKRSRTPAPAAGVSKGYDPDRRPAGNPRDPRFDV